MNEKLIKVRQQMAESIFEQIPWIRVGVGSVLQTADNRFYLVLDEMYSYRIVYNVEEGRAVIVDRVITVSIEDSPFIAIYKPKHARWFDEDRLAVIAAGTVDRGPYRVNREDMAVIVANKVEVKQMTVAEIEKALGYKVEVISGKEH